MRLFGPDHIWIWLTLVAVIAQTFRTAGQKAIAEHVSPLSATFVRYLFALPLVLAYFLILLKITGEEFPELSKRFWIFIVIIAFAQIGATVLMIKLFQFRNFAVGITLVRSETFLTALIGALVFAQAISAVGWLAVNLSVAGLILLAIAQNDASRTNWRDWVLNPSALTGLGAGLLFALTSLTIREANLTIASDNYWLAGATVLLIAVTVQTALIGLYLLLTDRAEFVVIWNHRKLGVFIGLTSAVGSYGWFTAFAVQNPAYVKVLGQLEVLLAIAISMRFFRERISKSEIVGIGLVVAGILLLLLF